MKPTKEGFLRKKKTKFLAVSRVIKLGQLLRMTSLSPVYVTISTQLLLFVCTDLAQTSPDKLESLVSTGGDIGIV